MAAFRVEACPERRPGLSAASVFGPGRMDSPHFRGGQKAAGMTVGGVPGDAVPPVDSRFRGNDDSSANAVIPAAFSPREGGGESTRAEAARKFHTSGNPLASPGG